jgi:hypothetical protein
MNTKTKRVELKMPSVLKQRLALTASVRGVTLSKLIRDTCNAAATQRPVLPDDVKKALFEAFRAGNLQGGDPAEHGKIPDELEKFFKVSFEAWFKQQYPRWGKRDR